ncbi:type I restriction endonuclease subunit R, partial [Salmonella enterica]|nr:type I restriction endonuclease subunit R [Salmonella enterica]
FRFRYDKFKPEALRTLAEESVYLNSFTKAISSSLREVDTEFVRYVASRSNVERQLNQKFLDSVTPLVKQAVERAVSAMVVSGLSTQPNDSQVEQEQAIPSEKQAQSIVDPDNPNIITTEKEIEFFDKINQILQTDDSITYKDTESYFSVLLDGKTNRWIVRFYDKKASYITFPIKLNEVQLNEIRRARLKADGNKINITRPDDVLKISGLVLDAFEYVKNDENFRRISKNIIESEE